MSKVVSTIGLVTSLAILFASYAVAPETADGGLRADASLGDGCTMQEIALDEGYGVTRTEMRVVCAEK